MKALRWLLPIASLLAVVWFTWWDVSRSQAGPGPVHPAHATVAALEGGANCAGCHDDGAVSAARCVACHAGIGAQLDGRRGVHGALDGDVAARCASCHSDHHGDQLPLLPPHAFARAGIDDLAAYDHRHVAFGLAGAHLRLPCASCHEHADAAAPPAGGRFLGLSQACTACHDDRHDGAFGADCARCHAQDGGWSNVPGFDHARFPLRGAHARASCSACHPDEGARSVAAERAARVDVRACRACHDDPHDVAPAGAPSATAALRFARTTDCGRCHEATEWAEARPTAAQHAALGHPLVGAHAAASCVACHGDAQAGARWGDGPAPASGDCAACHAHPHREGLVAAARAAAPSADGCADCHAATDASFAAGRISPEQHRATGFVLAAPHAEVACASCHVGSAREQRFPGRAQQDCRACHGDAHAGQFGAGDELRQCTECHAPHAFSPHAFDVDAHAGVWPLTGAHEAVACALCHDRVEAGVRRFVDAPRACEACHEDVHRGRFDAAGRPVALDGRRGCARCHDTSGFRPVTAAFDHALWTGYELVGAHGDVACASCHATATRERPGAVVGTSCADCHRDPHVGQFAVAGATDCRRCHDATRFGDVHFDHQRDSRFPLDRVHRELACSKCHVGYTVGGREVVRYRPLGRTCGDCHRVGERSGGGR